MELLRSFIDFFLHLDQHLEAIMLDYQTLTYLILCLIIFCETGLIATPILPGDSLLFAAGAITAKTGILNIWLLIPLLFASAILGDNTNYFVGKYFGHKVFEIKWLKRFIKREYLDRTNTFYVKHGGKTIILARFIPIVRTFAPFAAGVGNMNYRKYITYCVIGGSLWVTLLTLTGYFFGNLEFVKKNFELVIFGIIGISLIPVIVQFIKARLDKRKNATT
jgi:membrane-associated protein